MAETESGLPPGGIDINEMKISGVSLVKSEPDPNVVRKIEGVAVVSANAPETGNGIKGIAVLHQEADAVRKKEVEGVAIASGEYQETRRAVTSVALVKETATGRNSILFI